MSFIIIFGTFSFPVRQLVQKNLAKRHVWADGHNLKPCMMLNVARSTSSVEFYSTDMVGRYFVTSSFACLRGPGIRAVAECMVKSSSEETCESARRLLHCLGQANPRFTLNVYKGLVALFSSDLPIVQRMAATTVRRLQVGLLYVFGYFSVSCLLIQRNFTGRHTTIFWDKSPFLMLSYRVPWEFNKRQEKLFIVATFVLAECGSKRLVSSYELSFVCVTSLV